MNKRLKQNFLKQITFRSPTLDDAQQVLELMVCSDIAEYGEPDADMEDLQHDWSHIDLDKDAWMVFNDNGGLVGYAAVIPGGSKSIFDFYVDPNWKHEELNEILLSRCEVRVMEISANSGSSSSSIAKTYVAKVNQRDVNIVEQAGFKFVKYHFQMRMHLHSNPPKPDWPENITFRTFSLNQDERDVYELIERVFEKPGRTTSTFEEWKDHMLRPEIFEPELWFLCLEKGRIVGVSLCFEYPGEGWVRQLGVDESYRRRGLGTALLQHSFRAFKKRGINRVGLAVAADNLNANAFYENLGLECVRTYVEYEKMIEV